MMNADFNEALERAIALSRKRAIVRLAAITAAVAVGYAVLWFGFHTLYGILLAGIALVGAWLAVATGGTSAQRALKGYRGADVQQWLPSPSHGLVFATPKEVLVPGQPALSYDRLERQYLHAVSFDEGARELLFDCHARVTDRNGTETVDTKRVHVKVDPSVGDGAAYAFAREVDGKTQG